MCTWGAHTFTAFTQGTTLLSDVTRRRRSNGKKSRSYNLISTLSPNRLQILLVANGAAVVQVNKLEDQVKLFAGEVKRDRALFLEGGCGWQDGEVLSDEVRQSNGLRGNIRHGDTTIVDQNIYML